MNLEAVACIVCDEHDSGMECTERAEYREPLAACSPGDFADSARKYFVARGWRFGDTLGMTYCPRHSENIRTPRRQTAD
jgi:hypothetical protein